MKGKRKGYGSPLVPRAVLTAILLVGVACLVIAVGRPAADHQAATPPSWSAAVPRTIDPAVPKAVAKPRFLTTQYQAPSGSRTPLLGRLRAAWLPKDVEVAAVGWDGDAMAVPNDVSIAGWLRDSVPLTDLAGASLVAGHVADPRDRPGALSDLERARVGDIVEWIPESGQHLRFRVISISRYPRAQGLPPSLFRVDGPHLLRLVTCGSRQVSQGRIHYTDNVIVSAIDLR